MHILFAGGGTAGHINPALAVAGYIKSVEPQTKISYIGTANKLEAKLVPSKNCFRGSFHRQKKPPRQLLTTP